SYGTSHQFANAVDGASDELAKSLFEVGQVVSVSYMDSMITVEKDEQADWDELLPKLAVPIRAADSVKNGQAAAAAVGGAIAAAVSDDPVLIRINEILDDKIRPALAGDGGWLDVLSLE